MTEPTEANAAEPDETDGAHDPPPGPADHGREGGMATREVAPELAEKATRDKTSEG